MKIIKIYLHSKDSKRPREVVLAELVEDGPHSVKVKLPDGNIIRRKKPQDIYQEENEK